MELVSTCPLGVGSFAWQPHPAAHVLTIVCKATFALAPGVSPLADEQEEVAGYDNHWNDDEGASLYAPSDLTPPKRRADVMLVGSVFAPGGRPARSIVATLAVGGMQKSVQVHCDRAFSRDGGILEGAAFTRMALRWERAAGGPETVNPVGVRALPNAEGQIAIPNLQPPGRRITRLRDAFEPAGFGPIAPTWPSRAEVLGAHARGFAHARWFERPLPPDVDLRYFNAAPPDQQIDALAPDGRIALTNLHPRHPELVTTLARVRPRVRLERAGRPPEAVDLACDTLWIDTDRAIAVLVFRGNAVLSRPDEAGRAVITLEPEAPAPRAPLPAPKPPPRRRSPTLDGASPPARVATALPFMPPKRGDEAGRKLEGFRAVRGAPERGRFREETRAVDIEALRAQQVARKGGLPFSPTPAIEAKAPVKAAWADESTGTIEIDQLLAEREALPFAEPQVDAPPRAPAMTLPFIDPGPPRPPAPAIPFIDLPPPRAPAATMPFIELSAPAPTPPTLPPPRAPELTMALDELPPVRAPAPSLTAVDLAVLRADPAGALPFAATPAPAAPPIAAPPISLLETRAAPIAAAPIEDPPTISTPDAPAAEAIPIASYAAVKAALWGRDDGADVDRALRDLGLDEDAYRAGEERLHEALANEAREGRATLARAVRSAIKRAVSEMQARQPRPSQASGNVPAG